MRFLVALAMFTAAAKAAPAPTWTLIQNTDFEIYSQQGDTANVRASLMWLRQLHSFFAAAGLGLTAEQRVRVIGFRSVKDYNSYRLRPTADAYYVGTETRDYIVMPSLDPGKFSIAAHEYAHVMLHSAGMHLPSWLNEGLAEFFSNVRINNSRCEIGGDIRSHSQTLRTRAWMPLPRLLELSTDSLRDREESSLFYAQSWALTEMLLTSPEYCTRFSALIAAIASGQQSARALKEVYGKSLDAIAADMRAIRAEPTIAAPGVRLGAIKAISSEMTPFASRSMLAELLLATGELDRAQGIYDDLARESPQNTEVLVALGVIALRKGDSSGARLKWRQAIALGVTDATLCYRYAVLADDAGVSANEIRPALERAIALKPDFDDARFKLALLENTASNYRSALKQLEAMRVIAHQRAFGYWIAMAFAQDQLGEHEESKLSALKALHFAATAPERAQATQLAFVADTELTVQFTRDADGNPRLTTARVARGTESWNPFVEAQDHLRRAQGELRTVECGSDKIIGVAIDTADGPLKLAIPDPQHVLVRGANEFTCGPQPAREVNVEYAASEEKDRGVLRGIEVH